MLREQSLAAQKEFVVALSTCKGECMFNGIVDARVPLMRAERPKE